MHSQTVRSLIFSHTTPQLNQACERSTTKAPTKTEPMPPVWHGQPLVVQNSSGWYAIIIFAVLASPLTLLSYYSIQRAKTVLLDLVFSSVASFELVQFGWEFGRDNTWMCRVLVYVHPQRSVCFEEPVEFCSNAVADDPSAGGCCEKWAPVYYPRVRPL